MGHFGRRPIQLSWYALVLPALLLNYFGQAALLAVEPGRGGRATRSSGWRRSGRSSPLAVLATMATVIASQALISGAFSLTAQAVQLDYLPRLAIRHTSSAHIGQIYVPLVNWLLMIGCVGLVIGFQTSSNLAAAYGIAVTATMAITTLLFYRVVATAGAGRPREGARRRSCRCSSSTSRSSPPTSPRSPTADGCPLARRARCSSIQMTTWRRGRAIVAQILRRGQRRTEEVVDEAIADGAVARAGHGDLHVQGPGLRPAGDDLQPPPQPRAPRHDGRPVGDRVGGAAGRRRRPGDRDAPSRQACTRSSSRSGTWTSTTCSPSCASVQLDGDRSTSTTATFFIGRETVSSIPAGEMPRWREQLFVVLNRGSASASRFYQPAVAAGLRGRHAGRDLTAAGGPVASRAMPPGRSCSSSSAPSRCSPGCSPRRSTASRW